MRAAFILAAALISLHADFAHAAEPCQRIHGRATFGSGDGQFRIWHIGTHHTFRPDDLRTPDYTDFSPSWGPIMDLLAKNGKSPDDNAVVADFVVCPTQSFHQGASQPARVLHIYRPRIVPIH